MESVQENFLEVMAKTANVGRLADATGWPVADWVRELMVQHAQSGSMLGFVPTRSRQKGTSLVPVVNARLKEKKSSNSVPRGERRRF